MRNLKRALSLGLSSAMILGMMTFGAAAADKTAADLTDMGKVNNQEAVSLMVDLGIIVGKPDGSFAPTEGVDRATMAKLITYVMMGDVDQTAFAGTSTDLTDIDGQWAEGYIKYCYSNGIITGDGQGHFFPTKGVTVVEAAKMLLVALGYDATAQGYTGNPNWSTNIMKDAQKAGLTENLGLKATDTLTRDDAAQMIFNALFANTVSNTYGYDLNGNKYVSGTTANKTTLGEETYNLAKVEGAVTGVSANGNAIIDGVVSNLPANPQVIGTNAVYYKDSKTGKLISSSLAMGDSVILATSTNGTKVSELSDASKTSYLAGADTKVSYYINGLTKTQGDVETASDKAGVVVEFIDNNKNGKYDVVRVTEKTVDEIGDKGVTINKATAANKVDGITIDGIEAINGTVAASNVIGYEDLAPKDVVLYVQIGNKYYIEKAETATGTVTSRKNISGVDNYVMDGANYPVSGLVTATDVTDKIEYNKDMTFYLDNSGSIVKAVLNGEAEAPNYAVVADIVYIEGTVSAGSTSSGHAEALLVYADGTTEVKTIANIDGYKPVMAGGKIDDLDAGTHHLTSATKADVEKTSGSTTANAAVTVTAGNYITTHNADTASATSRVGKYIGVSKTNADTSLEGKFYSYKENNKGEYELTTVANTGVSGTYTNGSSAIGSVKVNNATVFVVATTKGSDVTYKSYTGISEMPSLSAISAGNAVVPSGKTFATYVFVNATLATDTTKDYAYITNTTYTEYVPKNGDVAAHYVYDAIVNGEVTTIKADSATIFNAGAGLWELKYVDGIVATDAATKQVEDEDTAVNNLNNVGSKYTGTVKAADGVIGLGSNFYPYADDAVVYFIDDATKAVTVGSISGVSTDSDDEVVAIVSDVDSDNNTAKTTITALYITVKGTNSGGTNPGGEDPTYSISGLKIARGASDNSLTVSFKTATALTAQDKVDIALYFKSGEEVSLVAEETKTASASADQSIALDATLQESGNYYVVVTIQGKGATAQSDVTRLALYTAPAV